MADEILEEFMAELGELLSTLERDLISVDGGRDPSEVVAQTFRVFHTVKGTAGFLGFDRLRELSHAAEDLLDSIRDGEVAWTRPVTDTLLQVLDALRVIMETISRTGGDGAEAYAGLVGRLREAAASMGQESPVVEPPPSAPVPVAPAAAAAPPPPGPPPQAVFQPLRAAPKLVRPPAPGSSPPSQTPAVPPPTAAPSTAPAATPPLPSAARPEPGHAPDAGDGGSLRVPVAVLDRLMNLVGELVLARNQLLCHEAAREDTRLGETSQRIDHLTAGLQESVMKARMQPIDNAFTRLPRVCRDAAQATAKRVRLVTSGAETELDKTLLEAIRDPLVHLVRNAVDHGVERPEQRVAAGKPEEGTVAVSAFQDGGQVVVEVQDDGGGVNLEKVRQKAVSSGLVTAEEAARLSERDTLDLVFRPGFSTAETVTQISGRGVGMDVVRTNVERIGGSVEMVSRAGRGSVCRVRVPLTLVIVPALIVESGDERYAVPQANLSELVRVPPEREARLLAVVQGTSVLRLRGAILPLVDLGAELRTGAARRAADGSRSVVVLNAQGRQFGLLVDEVGDTEEIVVKPLGAQLQQLGVYSGATVRGDGRVALVLDVHGLARRAGVLEDAERPPAPADAADLATGLSRRSYLLLRGADDGRLAIPLGEVLRLEEVEPARIEPTGAGEAIQYRGRILPLVRLSSALVERRRAPRAPAGAPPQRVHVVVQAVGGRDVGLVVDSVLDVVEEAVMLDASRARPGVVGCAVIQGRITEVLDTAALLSAGMEAPREAALG
ncbi:MAG TPA: chemotaxis protein CheA [Anaeromyxobacter sp.]|nr:chemotaxis protein CheA [Anaeromyxobacter sp.]